MAIEEIDDVMPDPPKSLGAWGTGAVYDRLKALQVGEEFTLKPSEWKSATPPTDSVGHSRRYRDRFQLWELKVGKGRVITRVK
jgi:hypothetical protein